MDTYAQLYTPAKFEISISTLQLLAVVFDAAVGTKRVEVKVFDNADSPLAGRIIEGVARHVVKPDNDSFPNGIWTENDRLRISSTFEFFIPLKAIEAINIMKD